MPEKETKKEKKKEFRADEAILEKMIVRAKPAGLRPPIPQPQKKEPKQKEHE